MRLEDYLTERDETEVAFAARSGIKRSTVNSICLGGGTGVLTAILIITATRSMVRLEDLLPAGGDVREIVERYRARSRSRRLVSRG